MAETVPFGGGDYFILLVLLVFGRGMDFLSTRVATPNLVLEGNPIARWMGWKWGGLVNAAMCVIFAMWPVPAIVIGTVSVLVAARNFQGAWLMRTMGEEHYRTWFVARLQTASRSFYLFCLFAQTALTVLVGGAVIYFSPQTAAVAQAIGASLVVYAAAVAIYTLFAFWRIRRAAI
jgi:hypothetical protein